MAARSQPPGVAALRAFAAARVGTDGMRATARDIGIQPSGLQYFLDGGKPHARTLRTLEDWYFRVADGENGGWDEETALIALGSLVRGLPVHRRAEAVRRSVAFYRELYRSLGTSPPRWLPEPEEGL
jgi:hypothetical protein